jgi:hypothetical protein
MNFKIVDMGTLETVVVCPRCKRTEWFQPEPIQDSIESFCLDYGYNQNLTEEYLLAQQVVINKVMTYAGHTRFGFDCLQ